MSTATKNNLQFSILTIVVFFLVLNISPFLLADQLNVNLTVSEPEGEYFEPGDDLTITLNITDNNDEFLRIDQYEDNGLFQVMLWVSGPRQEFYVVEPYLNFRILNQDEGYNETEDFNPENGEMTVYLPDDLEESGTYTALFDVRRVVENSGYFQYKYIDFQVRQTEQTFTQSHSYLTCNRPDCHSDLIIHETADTTNCAICHPYDYVDYPWDVIMHNWQQHQDNRVDESCHTCHRANAGVGNYGVRVCSSCHEIRAACRNYSSEQCVGCHGNDAYREHDEFVPREPRNFELIEPEDDVVLDTLAVELSWEETSDEDEEDIITYEVRLALDRRFRDKVIFNAGENTSITISDLENNTYYWWDVRAVDLNTFGNYCEDSRRFFTSLEIEPTPFSLHEPADGDTIGEDGIYETEFIWQLSEDPNLNDELHYAVHINLVSDPDSMTLIYDVNPDTIITLNPADSLGLDLWDEPLAVNWWVMAHSGEDTVECEERFSFWLFPHPYADEPTPFSLHEPADGDTIGEDGNYETEFIWQLSEDPNPNEELHYAVHLFLDDDHEPKTLLYNISPDTMITFNPVDSLELDFWDESLAVNWWVVAHSGEDTTECEERFSLWLFPNPNTIGEYLHEIPLDYYINDVYPNPFNSSQSIEFGLPNSGYVKIAVYDLSGRQVSIIANGELSTGRHQLVFDAAVLPGGIYFIRYNLANQLMDTQKVLLIR